MCWIVLLVLATAVVLSRLGALTVWVGLLSPACKVAEAVGLPVAAFVASRFVLND